MDDGDEDDLPAPEADRVVERGETYQHEVHGTVEVTGIWRGVKEVDSARNANQKDVLIVRYSCEKDGREIEELTDTLEEFLEAIE